MSADTSPQTRTCGAMGCTTTQDIQIVHTRDYDQRALCPGCRRNVEVNGRE